MSLLSTGDQCNVTGPDQIEKTLFSLSNIQKWRYNNSSWRPNTTMVRSTRVRGCWAVRWLRSLAAGIVYCTAAREIDCLGEGVEIANALKSPAQQASIVPVGSAYAWICVHGTAMAPPAVSCPRRC